MIDLAFNIKKIINIIIAYRPRKDLKYNSDYIPI